MDELIFSRRAKNLFWYASDYTTTTKVSKHLRQLQLGININTVQYNEDISRGEIDSSSKENKETDALLKHVEVSPL